MNRALVTAAAAALTLFAANFAHAGSIGVNVGPNRGDNEAANEESTLNNELPSGTSAGVVAQTNWNNLLEGNFGDQQVMDDSGTLLSTTASVSTQWTNGVAAHGSSDGDQILMNGGLDGGDGTTLSIAVTGITYPSYDVYVYYDGGNTSGLNGTYTADDGIAPQSALGTDNSNWNVNPAYVLDVDPEVGGNYLVFTGLTGANLTVSAFPTQTDGVDRAPLNGIQIVEAAPDMEAPMPDPMTFAAGPAAAGGSQITMTASTATDPSGVEYYFTETSGNPGGADSGWQDSETYTDTGLDPATTYTYTVTARDKSAAENETAASAAASATTGAPDVAAPTPNPMTFASAPAATSDTEIAMTASAATDPSGVEYYFAETSGNPGGADSGWQDSETYTNAGLAPSTTFSYTVTARDKSANQNETAASSAESATTNSGPVLGNLIGVNVGPNSGTLGEGSAAEAPENNELPSTTPAGVVPQANWNNLTGGSVEATQLMDDGGTLLATTATVSTQWTNGVQDHGLDDGDHILMNGGLDGGDTTTLSSTVTGIPYDSYDVYIYFDGGNDSGRGGVYSATPSGAGASDAQSQDGYDTSTFSGTYVQAIGSGLDDEGQPVGSNYVKFTGMSGENLEIASVPIPHPSNVNRAPWNGYQIVASNAVIVPFDITAIDYSPSESMITLTWESNPDEEYTVRFSTDLENWTSDLDDGIRADEGSTTTRSFDLSSQGLQNRTHLYFRVDKQE